MRERRCREGERLAIATGQVKEDEDLNQDTKIGENRGLKTIYEINLTGLDILNKEYTNHVNHSVSMPASLMKVTV